MLFLKEHPGNTEHPRSTQGTGSTYGAPREQGHSRNTQGAPTQAGSSATSSSAARRPTKEESKVMDVRMWEGELPETLPTLDPQPPSSPPSLSLPLTTPPHLPLVPFPSLPIVPFLLFPVPPSRQTHTPGDERRKVSTPLVGTYRLDH